jgi:quinol monooxygenase YgiN
MVLERAEFTAQAGKGDLVAEALRNRGLALAASYVGCQSFKALRCVEDPDTFLFLAEWDSIAAHHASREDPAHAEFRSLLFPHAASARETVHFEAL